MFNCKEEYLYQIIANKCLWIAFPQGVYVRSRFLDAKISSSLLLNSVLEYTTQLFWINMLCENKHNFCFYVLCNPLCEEVVLCSIGVIQLRWWFQQTYIYLSNQTFLYLALYLL